MDDLKVLGESLLNRGEQLVALEVSIVFLNTFTATLGNLLTLVIVYKNQRLRTIPNMFVISLAISDFVMAFPAAILNFGVLLKGKWLYGNVVCQVQGFLGVSVAVVSTVTLAMMSLNRYFHIVRPIASRKLFSRKTTRIMILTAWVVGILGQIPYVALGHRYIFHPGKLYCAQDVRIPFSTAIVSTFGAVPMAVIMFCCYKVFRAVQAHNKQRHRVSQQAGHLERSTVEDIKIAKVLLAMVVAFVLCFSPVMIIETIDFFHKGSYLPRQVYFFYNVIVCMSCSANPVIYVAMNKTFRREYKNLFQFRTRRQIQPNASVQSAFSLGHTEKSCNLRFGNKEKSIYSTV